MDNDGDGYLSLDELQANVRTSIKGQFSPEKIFRMLDLDKGGTISQDEFKQYFTSLGKDQGNSPQYVLSCLDKLSRKFRGEQAQFQKSSSSKNMIIKQAIKFNMKK